MSKMATIVEAFQYQLQNGELRAAWATQTEGHMTTPFISATVDSLWVIRDFRQLAAEPAQEWLYYRGVDGHEWGAKIRCKYYSKIWGNGRDEIRCAFENKRDDGMTNNTTKIFVYGSHGEQTRVTIMGVPGDHGVPRFEIAVLS